MRTWTRALVEERCGRCSAAIKVGEPFLSLVITGVGGRPKVRCKAFDCAGEAVPKDLPAHVAPAARPPIALERLGALPLDFSRAHDREPGEEG